MTLIIYRDTHYEQTYVRAYDHEDDALDALVEDEELVGLKLLGNLPSIGSLPTMNPGEGVVVKADCLKLVAKQVATKYERA